MSTSLEIKNKTVKIFLNKEEIETETLKQIQAMVKEDTIENARVMPDCHKSKNCCVGFTSKLVDKIVPNYVGNDIGCGIVSYPIEMQKSVECIRQKQLEKIVDDIDVNVAHPTINMYNNRFFEYTFENFKDQVSRIFDLSNIEVQKFKEFYLKKFGKDISDKIPTYNQEWLEIFLKRTNLSNREFYGSLMTLGSGNHFIEFNRSDNTLKEYITVHSGSRIVGRKICISHQKKFILQIMKRNGRSLIKKSKFLIKKIKIRKKD